MYISAVQEARRAICQEITMHQMEIDTSQRELAIAQRRIFMICSRPTKWWQLRKKWQERALRKEMSIREDRIAEATTQHLQAQQVLHFLEQGYFKPVVTYLVELNNELTQELQATPREGLFDEIRRLDRAAQELAQQNN